MNLKEFIKTALVDISEAIYEAKDSVGDKVAIAPFTLNGKEVDREQLIDFEIQVMATDTKTKEGKGEIKVISMGSIGAEGAMSSEMQKISKIKFQVPVFYAASFDHKKKLTK